MAFAFQPYDNSQSIGQILALMQAGAHAHADAAMATGDAQARAAAISSQNSAQMADTLGHIALGVSGQIAQQFSPEAKARTADIAAQTAERQAQAEDRQHRNALAEQEQQNRQRLNGLLQESTITDPTTGLVTYDRNTLTKGLTSLGLGDKAPEYLKLLDNSDAAVKTARAAQTDALKQIATVVDATGNDPVVFGNEVQRAIKNGVISERMAAPYLAAVQRDPEHVGRVTGALLGRQPSLMAVKPGETVIDKNNPTAPPVLTAPVKPEHSAAYKEFEDAKSQGFAGTFEQYQDKDANRHKPVVNVGGGTPAEGALDPDGLQYAATQYRLTGQMPALGMGKNADRGKIINEAAKQTKLIGQTPAVAMQRQASRKADSASLTRMQTMKDGAEAAETKALGQADIIAALSKKVDRTSWPILNKAIIAGAKNITGDSSTTQLYNAILTFGQEYGKLIEGSSGSVAGSSEGSRAAASKLVNAAMSKGTLDDVLGLMKKEMGLTLQGYDATIDHISGRLGGQAPTPQVQPQTAAPAAPQAAPAGQIIVTAPDGSKHPFATQAQADAFKRLAGIR